MARNLFLGATFLLLASAGKAKKQSAVEKYANLPDDISLATAHSLFKKAARSMSNNLPSDETEGAWRKKRSNEQPQWPAVCGINRIKLKHQIVV